VVGPLDVEDWQTDVKLTWGQATNVGCVRELNEDAVIAALPIFAVADGMGGHAAGEVASGLTITALAALAGQGEVSSDDVLNAIRTANATIAARAREDAGQRGMGTTVTGLAVVSAESNPHWLVFNVGDSRVYRLVDGVLEQLTIDHSEVEELVMAGSISRSEARVHPRRNVITRSLGTQLAPTTDEWLLPPIVGERFLVCSDGLFNEVDDDQIAALMSSIIDPQSAADALVAAAVSAGGADNISVIVVDVLGLEDSTADEDTAPRPGTRSSTS
jgi:serine/threonine protein phosphatase PrpC